MRGWASQIVIGIIVTVVGTLVANPVMKKHGRDRHFSPAAHYSGPARPNR